MNLLNKIWNFINRAFKKSNTKLLKSPIDNKSNEKNNFNKSLKVIIESANIKSNNKEKNIRPIIETLQCENDGLGFQSIKNN